MSAQLSSSISVPVSTGEALDKLSILQIKKELITDSEKHKAVEYEFELLLPLIKPFLDCKDINNFYIQLYNINKEIWDASDAIRILDKTDSKYIEKLIWIMEKNDQRYRIKADINKLSGSSIKEQKSYPNIFENNYVCCGKLGDLIHSIYGIMLVYLKTGKKGNLYITEDLLPHHGKFTTGTEQTYRELEKIILAQEYINSFSIYDKEKSPKDYIDLSSWYKSDKLYKTNWCNLIASSVGLTQVPKKWLSIPKSNVVSNEIEIVIHRSLPHPYISFPWENILTKNKCCFITCNQAEYDAFPWKNLVKLHLCSTILELATLIDNAKFFIGNQSSPLAFACAMHKPCFAELVVHGPDAPHYIWESFNNPNFFWWGGQASYTNEINKFLEVDLWAKKTLSKCCN